MSEARRLSVVVPLSVGELNDVPAMLRKLAAAIEAGEHGCAAAREQFGDAAIIRAAVVLRVAGQEPAVFGFGRDMPPAQAFMDLHAGAQQIMMMTHPERG